MPLDGLMAEEIDLKKTPKTGSKSSKDGPFQKVQEESSGSSEEDNEDALDDT